MIKYIYVACFKVVIWFVFDLYGLIVFMVYCEITYSEPCQTFKMELLVKIVTSKETTFLLRSLRGF